MRIACVLIHHFAVQVELARQDKASAVPLVIGGLPFERRVVYDASPEAMACGVKKGIPLAQASVLCPEARFVPADEALYGQVAGEIADLLEQFSPAVEMEEEGCAYLDVTGCESEPALVREMVGSLVERRLRPCCGVAGNKFVARVGAYAAKPERPVVVPAGGEADFVAPVSIRFLPVSEDTRERLDFLGIQRVRQIAQIPREALETQFGEDGLVLHRLSRGLDEARLKPRRKPRLLTAAVDLDGPAGTLGELLPVVEKLVNRLVRRLRREWLLCCRVSLRLTSAAGLLQEKTLNMKQATSSVEAILLRVRSWVAETSPGGEVSGVEVSLEITGDKGAQADFWSQRSKAKLDSLARALQDKFGYQPLKRAVSADPDALLPEDRFKLVEVG